MDERRAEGGLKMIDRDTRIRIEEEYFNSNFQNLDIIDKETSVRERLQEVKDLICVLNFEKADLQRWLGQRDD